VAPREEVGSCHRGDPRRLVGVDAQQVDGERVGEALHGPEGVLLAAGAGVDGDRQDRHFLRVECADQLAGDLGDAELGAQVADEVDAERRVRRRPSVGR
jgi:hypothetical protein